MNHKIAVCLYGQPRSWQYCAPWIKESFSPEMGKSGTFRKFDTTNGINDEFMISRRSNLEIDFFLNVKNYNTFANTTDKETEIVDDSEIERIVSTYKPKKHSVTSLASDLAHVFRPGDWHFSRMLSSICAVNELKKQYEAEQEFVYDAVIMHRFDVMTGPKPDSYLSTLLARGVEPLAIYSTSPDDFRMYRELWKSGFDDMVFAGDSLGMDLLTAYFYRKFENTIESNSNEIDYRTGPNVTITEAMFNSSIVRRYVPAELAIVRTEADLNRPVMTSFKYHQDFWRMNHRSHEFK